MESEIKKILKTSTLKIVGHGGGGSISEGDVYITDTGKVFIKKHSKLGARVMFDGELESLKAINATNTIRSPKGLFVIDNPTGGAGLVMEYLDIKSVNRKANALGEKIARLHLHNIEMQQKEQASQNKIGNSNTQEAIYEFGFHTKTSCGFIAQENTWNANWTTFYAHKLKEQMDLIEKEYGDREAMELWSSLVRIVGDFFKNIEIKPSLLHGDLWSGNVGEVDKEPVVFDPASFYGHHEYDLGIAGMFGGFNQTFWDSYHNILPKDEDWERRHQLYLLFHHLNHWNHFGSGYRSGSLAIMKKLIQ